MDYSSRHVAVVPVSFTHIHQLAVAAIVSLSVNYSLDALACDLGYFSDQGLIDMSFMRSYDGLSYRMARKALAACSNIQKLGFAYDIRMDVIYRKYAFCKRSRLIENNSVDLRQDFHISGALYEDTVFGCTADTTEERQRNRYDECAGTGYYKEYACSRKPYLPNLPVAHTDK